MAGRIALGAHPLLFLSVLPTPNPPPCPLLVPPWDPGGGVKVNDQERISRLAGSEKKHGRFLGVTKVVIPSYNSPQH